jgi:hypothetical protein
MDTWPGVDLFWSALDRTNSGKFSDFIMTRPVQVSPTEILVVVVEHPHPYAFDDHDYIRRYQMMFLIYDPVDKTKMRVEYGRFVTLERNVMSVTPVRGHQRWSAWRIKSAEKEPWQGLINLRPDNENRNVEYVQHVTTIRQES